MVWRAIASALPPAPLPAAAPKVVSIAGVERRGRDSTGALAMLADITVIDR
jgi:hypothetical protein